MKRKLPLWTVNNSQSTEWEQNGYPEELHVFLKYSKELTLFSEDSHKKGFSVNISHFQ